MARVLQLNIIKPGIQSSIQDQGRHKFRAFGTPSSGPMDRDSAQLANKLVGNHESNPVLEFAMRGPEIELQGEGLLAITGADFKIRLNMEPVPMNKLIIIRGNKRLSISNANFGCWGYLGIAGNWQLHSWLGSTCTSPQNTRELTPDSLIEAGTTLTINSGEVEHPSMQAPREILNAASIRVLAGPEYHLMRVDIIKEFLSKSFTVSSQSNRMGYRLLSALSHYKTPVEIISSAVLPGTVQLTHSGELIVLMADAQTTGGYPRIANVISPDLDLLAQLRPGDQFRFQLVSQSEVLLI